MAFVLRGCYRWEGVIRSLDRYVLLGCVWRHMFKELLPIDEEIVFEQFAEFLSGPCVVGSSAALAGSRRNFEVFPCDWLFTDDNLKGIVLEILFVVLNFNPWMCFAPLGSDFFKVMQSWVAITRVFFLALIRLCHSLTSFPLRWFYSFPWFCPFAFWCSNHCLWGCTQRVPWSLSFRRPLNLSRVLPTVDHHRLVVHMLPLSLNFREPISFSWDCLTSLTLHSGLDFWS